MIPEEVYASTADELVKRITDLIPRHTPRF